jgi:hypothetical protein
MIDNQEVTEYIFLADTEELESLLYLIESEMSRREIMEDEDE